MTQIQADGARMGFFFLVGFLVPFSVLCCLWEPIPSGDHLLTINTLVCLPEWLWSHPCHQLCHCRPLHICCEYTNIFPFSHLFKVSITFLISFHLPLFRLYYLEPTDIFPTFLPSNTRPKNPYSKKGTLGKCSERIRNFPLLASHV